MAMYDNYLFREEPNIKPVTLTTASSGLAGQAVNVKPTVNPSTSGISATGSRIGSILKQEDAKKELLGDSYGLAASAANSTFSSVDQRPPVDTTSLDAKLNEIKQAYENQGISRNFANAQAVSNIGLGFLSFLENRKTAKLEREGLKQDIQAAKEFNARKKSMGDSWSAAWNN